MNLDFSDTICIVLYCTIVALLSVFGFHRWLMLRLYFKHRGETLPLRSHFSKLPGVTVQLPLYNEYHVVERLLAAVSEIDYPKDRLQIQVLDDSVDETRDRALQTVAQLAGKGFDIQYLHRNERTGFKAGALAAGLKSARYDFIFVLDADFVPPSDVLHRAIHYFTDPKIGMVQMRWGHLNRDYSLLTRIQSIFLDGHLVIEHTARCRSGRFFNFNGTAGLWRKQSITEAGGWEHDTLTEDLDLSYRAQLAGWKFLFLPDVEIPAELPVEINAFKSQQHRWTKGAVQTAKKILPRIWRSSIPLKLKIEATFHLTANSTYLLMLAMAILMFPVFEIRAELEWRQRMLIIDLPLFSIATMAISGFYLVSQKALYVDWQKQILLLPVLMAIGISLCVNNARAVFEALVGYETTFKRTPKYGVTEERIVRGKYAGAKTLVAGAEISMAFYFVTILQSAWSAGLYFGIPFLLLFQTGFLYTGVMSLFQPWFYSRLNVQKSSPTENG